VWDMLLDRRGHSKHLTDAETKAMFISQVKRSLQGKCVFPTAAFGKYGFLSEVDADAALLFIDDTKEGRLPTSTGPREIPEAVLLRTAAVEGNARRSIRGDAMRGSAASMQPGGALFVASLLRELGLVPLSTNCKEYWAKEGETQLPCPVQPTERSAGLCAALQIIQSWATKSLPAAQCEELKSIIQNMKLAFPAEVVTSHQIQDPEGNVIFMEHLPSTPCFYDTSHNVCAVAAATAAHIAGHTQYASSFNTKEHHSYSIFIIELSRQLPKLFSCSKDNQHMAEQLLMKGMGCVEKIVTSLCTPPAELHGRVGSFLQSEGYPALFSSSAMPNGSGEDNNEENNIWVWYAPSTESKNVAAGKMQRNQQPEPQYHQFAEEVSISANSTKQTSRTEQKQLNDASSGDAEKALHRTMKVLDREAHQRQQRKRVRSQVDGIVQQRDKEMKPYGLLKTDSGGDEGMQLLKRSCVARIRGTQALGDEPVGSQTAPHAITHNEGFNGLSTGTTMQNKVHSVQNTSKNDQLQSAVVVAQESSKSGSPGLQVDGGGPFTNPHKGAVMHFEDHGGAPRHKNAGPPLIFEETFFGMSALNASRLPSPPKLNPTMDEQTAMNAIGRWGEQFVYDHLKQQGRQQGKVTWVNETGESGKPFDLIVVASCSNGVGAGNTTTTKYCEVKTTIVKSKNYFDLTLNELDFSRKISSRTNKETIQHHGSAAHSSREVYVIYRVVASHDFSQARLLTIEDPARYYGTNQALRITFWH